MMSFFNLRRVGFTKILQSEGHLLPAPLCNAKYQKSEGHLLPAPLCNAIDLISMLC